MSLEFSQQLLSSIEDRAEFRHRVTGCSSVEISAVEETVGVRLPQTYKIFLSIMGKSQGVVNQGTKTFYPEILELTAAGRELLEENEMPFHLGNDDFVFFMHQGYSIKFFNCNSGNDPEVYEYVEGDQSYSPSGQSLSDWLLNGYPEFFGDLSHLETIVP